MSILSILESIASDNSKNHKIAMLEESKNSELLKKVIFMALDPFTLFYVKKIPQYTPSNVESTLAEALTFLEQNIVSRQITGNAALSAISDLLSKLSESDAEVMKRVILKDLKCGIAEATANKVWKGLIKEYPVMLCSQYEEKVFSKIKLPAYAQLKMDGMRFNAVVVDRSVSFYTRNGKPVELLTESLAHDFIKLADILGKDKVVFDGELVVYENGNIANRQTGNGILNKAVRGTISEAESDMIQATIWDVIDYDAFSSASADKTTYEERFGTLQKINLQGIYKIGLVESFEVNSTEEIRAIYTKYLEAGQEGIILKDKRGIWENKRTKSQIKFKNESACELLVTNWIEGTGKYEGVLGALSCQSSDGNLSVNVGSGFNEAQRSEITRESIIGKIVEVKYNGKIVNKNGGNSLFLPIFVRIREDKDVANNIDEIS